MLNSKASVDFAPSAAGASSRSAGWSAASPDLAAYFAVLDPVLVERPVYHHFAGAIERPVAVVVWSWIERVAAPHVVEALSSAIASGTSHAKAFDAVAETLLAAIRDALAREADDPNQARRNSVQLGGDETRRRLSYVIMALRRRTQLAQATQFGRALGYIQDEAALITALGTITIKNPVTKALWLQAMVGAVTNPTRVMSAAVKMAGGNDDTHLEHAGFAPLVDAILSHAQNQLSALMTQPGVFNDYDLACRAIDRFHRLMRSLSYSCEFSRKGRWATIIADLTGRFSERLERPLRQISSDVTLSLRRPREGDDVIEPDAVLAGLNGLYLLSTIRRSRDTLAVNAVLDQVWGDTGQTLEVLVTRALDMYRQDPSNLVARERLDAGIKMAEIRYNAAYADILRRARDGAERRTQSMGEGDAAS